MLYLLKTLGFILSTKRANQTQWETAFDYFEVSGVLNYTLRLKETGHRGLQQLPVGEGLGIFFFVAVLIYLFLKMILFLIMHTRKDLGGMHT